MICKECGINIKKDDTRFNGDFYNVIFCSRLCKERWQARNHPGEPKTISEICVAAKDQHMTYGQYQSKRYSKELIRKREEMNVGNDGVGETENSSSV